MRYCESNFIYLKETKLKKYYDELVKAECAVEKYPRVSKIIIRKVVEDLLRIIAKEHNINAAIGISSLIENIKVNCSFLFPQEIYNEIETIRCNGNQKLSYSNEIAKDAIELLEILHNILCCYLKEIEPEAIIKIKDLSFCAPTNIEDDIKLLKKIKEEISLKNNQIDNLRERVIELGNQSKNIGELTNIIIAIRKEKSNLENIEKILINKIKIYNIELIDLEKNYEKYIKNFDELSNECNQNQQLIINKQDQLVRAELENQQLKNLIKTLEEQDFNITKQAKIIDEQLEDIRKSYERSLNRSHTYQDIIETIEFSYSNEIKKELEFQKISVQMEVEFEDRKFNEIIGIYNKNVEDIKRKVKIFKEILSDKIKKEIKFEEFYKAFLKLEGKQLRIIYAMLVNSKSKSLEKGNEQSFNQSLNEKIESLKSVSDDNIRLFLYYKLIKIGNVRFEVIYNKKNFINTLDRMIERSYNILASEKEFRIGYNRLESIIMYYLEKVIQNLKKKYNNVQIQEKLVDNIYKVVRKLNSCAAEIIHNKIDVKNAEEDILKMAIRKEPFEFLLIIFDFGGIELYYQICNIIFELSQSIIKSYSSTIGSSEVSLLEFLKGPFIMLVFISSEGPTLNRNQDEKLLALIVMEILIMGFNLKNNELDETRYDRMTELWKRNQQKYNDIFIQKQDKEEKLKILLKEKQDIEIRYDKVVRNYTELCSKYNKFNEQFRNIVLNSGKGSYLPSYKKYIELINQKRDAETHINEVKSKFGALKSVLSPEMWKEHANKIRSESQITEIEKLLILEAKENLHFQKEQQDFLNLKNNISDTKELMDEEKQNLEEKLESINKLKVKIDKFNTQLNIIKETYVDMEAEY